MLLEVHMCILASLWGDKWCGVEHFEPKHVLWLTHAHVMCICTCSSPACDLAGYPATLLGIPKCDRSQGPCTCVYVHCISTVHSKLVPLC